MTDSNKFQNEAERELWLVIYTHFTLNDRRENADGSTTIWNSEKCADEAVADLRARMDADDSDDFAHSEFASKVRAELHESGKL